MAQEAPMLCYQGDVALVKKEPAWLLLHSLDEKTGAAEGAYVITVYTNGKVAMFTCTAVGNTFYDRVNGWSMNLQPMQAKDDAGNDDSGAAASKWPGGYLMKAEMGWQRYSGSFPKCLGFVSRHEILRDAEAAAAAEKRLVTPETVCPLPWSMRRVLPCHQLALIWAAVRHAQQGGASRPIGRLNDDCLQRVQEFIAGPAIEHLSFGTCRNTWGAGGGAGQALVFAERLGRYALSVHVVATIGGQAIARAQVTEKSPGVILLAWKDNDDAQRSAKPRNGTLTIDFARRGFEGQVQFPGEGGIGYESVPRLAAPAAAPTAAVKVVAPAKKAPAPSKKKAGC